ncbi:LysR substrate-binding domain-containing protein [Agaribacterium sp. ZY112]|uniref:LysR substrate-binding domain-containing protein n=1 Tax=Agaribacterium sp. ZY112 TaxID=3233574 RepID=UPI0035265D39
MKFSLKQVQVFQLVAELESVSEAAKQLHMSQSAASMALAQLESQLGKELFIRQGRRMALSNWGAWLRPHAYSLLESCNTIEQGMQDMDLISGVLRIGASQTPAEYMVPQVISALDRDFPHLQLKLGVENTEHVIEALLDYRYDLGIIEGHCDSSEIQRQKWCEDELVVIAGVEHPYTKMSECSITQLGMAQWILREHGAGTREIFDIAVHEHLEQIQVHREYEQSAVILELVSHGRYLSCLSRRLVQPWLERGLISILNTPALSMKRDISFIWRRQDDDSPNRDALTRAARKLID